MSVTVGVGDASWIRVATKGALCGKGDISMESFPGAGEEEGSGGVVTHSDPM